MGLTDLLRRANVVRGYGKTPEEAIVQARAVLPFTDRSKYALYREITAVCDGEARYAVKIEYKIANDEKSPRQFWRPAGAASLPNFEQYERI